MKLNKPRIKSNQENVENKKDRWDISNRISTKTKLAILKKCFNVWLSVWNKQEWASNEWYVIDLFAGRGLYADNDKNVYGSPLVFLDTINQKINILGKDKKIKLFMVEKNKINYNYLINNTNNFIKNNPYLEKIIEIECFNDDCNKSITQILEKITKTNKNPIFVLIDPWGIKIKKDTIENIVRLPNRKDIMFNYILEGVRRAGGIAKKKHHGEELNIKEIKTLETLSDFIGEDIDVIKANDKIIMENYLTSVFYTKDLKVVGYDMKYPNRKDILYYLLYASKKQTITDIVKDIYAKQKEDSQGMTLFGGREYYKSNLFSIHSKIRSLKRKSLLYKTKVEYGNWTINHIVGCMHGCKYPCYAMMMAKKFGWVKDYNEWRRPRIVKNALELLEKEIPKYKKYIDFVHLSFMSDPFMFDSQKNNLVPEIKKLTLNIIKRLNKENIKVTVLTKGYYPDEIISENLMRENEYGITLVSLNNKFKKEFEPFSSPSDKRISSLKKLHNAGLKTWVSIEPYPTPNLDDTAANIENILEEIKFVDKVIFGKLNYNVKSTKFLNNQTFYSKISKKVSSFCEDNDIKYHIKHGTPYSNEKTKSIFKET
jgi:three-Cys-motif partner protein